MKRYIKPETAIIEAESAMPMAASLTQITIETGSDYEGEFYANKHFDVWADDDNQQ